MNVLKPDLQNLTATRRETWMRWLPGVVGRGNRTMGQMTAKVIAVGVIFVSTVTAAEDTAAMHVVSGTDLYTWCLSAAQYQVGLCDGYIEGLADVMEERKTVGGFAACVPAPLRIRSTAQLLEPVKQVLASHPEKRDLPATSLVASALAEAFPCH